VEISKLDNKQFSLVFGQVLERIKADPIENFVRGQGFIDLDPTPVQEVILKTIFSKPLDLTTKKEVSIEARTTEGGFDIQKMFLTEPEIYEFLTEAKYTPGLLSQIKVNKIDLICGRRSGKSMLSAIIAIYCAISTNWKPFLKKTPYATVLIMSHSKDFSDEILEVIRSMIENSELLSRLINKEKKNTSQTMNLKIPFIKNSVIEYSRVQIKVAAASSKTTRGVAACAVLCDEACFWGTSEEMKESDTKVIEAVRPAMKQFGEHAMLIKLSSPGAKRGVVYTEYLRHREGTLPASYAVFKAPTWMMNNLISIQDLKEEHELDPDSFDTEYRSNFRDSLSNFILPERIDSAVLKSVLFQAPDGSDGQYFAAIDAAFKADAFTFTVVGYTEGRLRQFISKGWKGSGSEPVSPYEVAEYIRSTCKEFGITRVGADQYAFQPLKEIFAKYGVLLEEYNFSSTYKKKIYFNLKKLFHSNQIDILENPVLVRELKELVVEQTNSGNIKISHPMGGTDDYADSLAIASYLATEKIGHGNFEFMAAGGNKNYGIEMDINGRAFTAPSIDMLVDSGYLPEGIVDNSDDYVWSAEKQCLVRVSDADGEDPDTKSRFSF
jgi:hypothetical protein